VLAIYTVSDHPSNKAELPQFNKFL